MAEDELDDNLPWYLLVLYVLAVVAGFAAMVWCTIGWYGGCDDGRHTSPFTAGDSLRGTLCEAGGGVATGLAIPVGWVLGLVLATVVLVRGGRTVLVLVLVLTPLLLPAAAYAGLTRSGTTCPDDKLAAYREWADAGSKGTAPYDCRTF